MPITTAICTSYKQEVLQGIHASGDTYRAALFTNVPTLNAATTTYSTSGEITGTGYTAGGVALTGFTTATSGTTAWLDFNDPSWANATFTARGMVIYNASKANRAVAVYDFGADITATNGTFTVQLPVADATNALVRIA